MNASKIVLTDSERIVLQQCSDTAATHRRIRSVIVMATLFALTLTLMSLLVESPIPVLCVAVIYISITTFEKVSYGHAVLLYKSVISKLVKRVAELEEIENA